MKDAPMNVHRIMWALKAKQPITLIAEIEGLTVAEVREIRKKYRADRLRCPVECLCVCHLSSER